MIKTQILFCSAAHKNFSKFYINYDEEKSNEIPMKMYFYVANDFNESQYTKAIKIPKGARKIEFAEMEPSINFIAVKNEQGEFILNGQPDKGGESDGEKDLDGNLALYEHVEPKKELLYIPGPTNEDLTFFVYFNDDDNVGYQYKYYVFTDQSEKGGKMDLEGKEEEEDEAEDTSDYHWENVEWSKCSARCDGGESKSESKCICTSGGGEVNDQFCLKLVAKPETKTKVCNRDECKASWHTGDWAPCSGCKHHPGAQFRSVWCAKLSPRWDETDVLTSEQDCVNAEGLKPLNKQLCVDECKKVNCRRGRAANTNKQIEIDAKDIYNYKFFEKLFRKINRDMKEPSEEAFQLCIKDDKADSTPDKLAITKQTMALVPEPTTFNCASDSNDNDTETQVNNVQNPDTSSQGAVKCPTRSLYNSESGKKHMMFLFPRRRDYRRIDKTSRACNQQPPKPKIKKPPLSVVKDKVPEEAIKIEEAKIKIPNTDFLSDVAYQKLGDRITGSIDLDNEKVWSGARAIHKIEKERKKIDAS